MNTNYDLIVIGGGAAGLVAAKLAHGLGKRVAIVEHAKLGGDCTWNGCVPSKTLINISHMIAATKKADNFLKQPITEPIDSVKIMAYIRSKRNEIYQTHTPEMLKNAGIDTFFGDPQFVDQTTITMQNQTLHAKNFIIATGSRPFIPDIEGLSDVSYLTNETIFELPQLPKSMIILGGGPISIELACALNNLGVHVTIIEKAATILPKEDAELSSMLAEHMRANGIDIHTSVTATKVFNKNGITCVGTQPDNTTIELSVESLLVAVGRKPNIENLNLAAIGVNTTKHGITVNSTLQTSAKNIYACGDVVGPYQFSHMAEYQAAIAGQNACIPLFKKHVNYNHTIWVTFSDPEFAIAGLNEAQARTEYGDTIQIFRMPYSALDRAKIDDATFGLLKIICDKKGYILGAHILGARAGELIHEIQVGKYYNKRIWDFYGPIHAYPTYSELIKQIAKKAYIQKLQNNVILRWIKKLFTKQS